MGKLIGLQRAELPVYICCRAAEGVEALSLSLRGYGLRTRVFAHVDVMETAARSHQPLALLLCGETAAEAARNQVRQRIEAGWSAAVPLAVLGRDAGLQARLDAALAGANAYFAPPYAHQGVLAFLHGQLRGESEAGTTLAVVTEPGSALARLSTPIAGPDLSVRLEPPCEQLPERLTENPPDLVVLDGDLTGLSPLSLAAALRQTPGMASVPIMLGTSAAKRDLDAGASEAGVDRLFGLPVAAEDLCAMALSLVRRSRQQAWAHRQALRRDPATGLLSREHFLERLVQIPLSGTEVQFSLLCVALDGHGAGAESAARETAEELQQILPPSAPAARLEPNLFAALMEGPDPDTLAGLSARLERRIEAVASQRRRSLRVRTTRVTAHHRNLLEALEEACSRVNNNKSVGPVEGLWSSRVRAALRENRFRLVFQPVSGLSGQFEELFETFLRMLDSQGEDIPPHDFMPPAREAGLARELDRWVLEHAVRVLAARSGGVTPTLFVKLLPESVEDPGLVPWITELLARESVAPERLVLEIPHGCALRQRATTEHLLAALGELGCGRTLEYFDDAADAALEALELSLDYLKLAPALTDGLAADEVLRQRVEAITRHCRERGIAAIASRVQEATALAVMWRCGIEFIQGNFMQEPADVFAAAEPRPTEVH